MSIDQPRVAQAGFTYIALLIAIALIGVASAAAVTVGATMQRRMAEDELLFIGLQFQRAFESYRANTRAGQLPFPESLEELVRDTRGPTVRRHLRQIYVDPLTGQRDWGLVAGPGGRIAGVYSKADGQPFKIANFALPLVALEGKARYSEWVFGNAADALIKPQGTSPPANRLQ